MNEQFKNKVEGMTAFQTIEALRESGFSLEEGASALLACGYTKSADAAKMAAKRAGLKPAKANKFAKAKAVQVPLTSYTLSYLCGSMYVRDYEYEKLMGKVEEAAIAEGNTVVASIAEKAILRGFISLPQAQVIAKTANRFFND